MKENHELQSSHGVFPASKLKNNTQQSVAERDEAELMRLGKRPVLKVRLYLSMDLIFLDLRHKLYSADSGSCHCWASAVPSS